MFLKQTIHIAVYEHKQYQILCQIHIKPRTIQIYKQNAKTEHRWFDSSTNWYRFEAELHRVLDQHEWSDKNLNGEFYLDRSIKIKYKTSSRMPAHGLWQQKDIAIALECFVEFKENCTCSLRHDKPVTKRPKIVSSSDCGNVVETRSGSCSRSCKELLRFSSHPPHKKHQEPKQELGVGKNKNKKSKHKDKNDLKNIATTDDDEDAKHKDYLNSGSKLKHISHSEVKSKARTESEEDNRSKDLDGRLEKPTTSKKAKHNLDRRDSEEFRQRQNERVEQLFQQLQAIPVTPDPPEVDILPLNDMILEKVLNTFELYKSKIDEVYKDLRGKSIVERYKSFCHLDVIDLLSEDTQFKMMGKLADAYSMPPSGKTTSWITNAMLPTWIANIFKDRYKMTFEEAVKHIKAQQAYKDFLKHEKQKTCDLF